MAGIRRCTNCKKDLPESDFTPTRARCKPCRSEIETARQKERTRASWDKDLAGTYTCYLDFAHEKEAEIVRLLNDLGTVSKVAAELGITPTKVLRHLGDLKSRAGRRGYAPDHKQVHTVPEGQHIKGVSTLYDGDGNIRAQWVKSANDKHTDDLQTFLDACQTLFEPWKDWAPLSTPPPAASIDKDRIVVYPMGDPHLGMLAWARETGVAFDLQIAERELYKAVDMLVGLAPTTEIAVIVPLGDLYHVDNELNQTTSGTPQDADSRYPKMAEVGINLARRSIERALEKHSIVHVICVNGNHDRHSSMWLAQVLKGYYHNDPRVVIDTHPGKYHWFEFGENLIGFTHGDTCKLAELGAIMACDQKEAWGRTKFRNWYTGHVHHDTRKELTGGVVVETFRTLAPNDKWHHGKGYRSGKDMRCDVIHKRFGRVCRHIVGIEQIQEQIEDECNEI